MEDLIVYQYKDRRLVVLEGHSETDAKICVCRVVHEQGWLEHTLIVARKELVPTGDYMRLDSRGWRMRR